MEMTEIDKLKAAFNDIGIPYEMREPDHWQKEQQILMLNADIDHPKAQGYAGFGCWFVFDKNGSFEHYEVGE